MPPQPTLFSGLIRFIRLNSNINSRGKMQAEVASAKKSQIIKILAIFWDFSPLGGPYLAEKNFLKNIRNLSFKDILD